MDYSYLGAFSVPLHPTFAIEQSIRGQCYTFTFSFALWIMKTQCIYFASVKQQHAMALAKQEIPQLINFSQLENIKLDYFSDRDKICRRCCTAKTKHLSKCWEAQSGVKEWEEIALTGEANVLSGATAKMNWLNRWRSGWGPVITVIHGTCGRCVLSHWRQQQLEWRDCALQTQ